MVTRLQLFKDKWSNGCGACICPPKANRVCLFRGTVPCHVLFIGEAPGEGEDATGLPFVGVAGALLDSIIEETLGRNSWCSTCYREKDSNGMPKLVLQFSTPSGMTCVNGHGGEEGIPITYALTNLVGCIPLQEDTASPRSKMKTPSVEDIQVCSKRLQDFANLCKPRAVVAVGTLAKDFLMPGFKRDVKFPKHVPIISIRHPAYILRVSEAQRTHEKRNCINAINDGLFILTKGKSDYGVEVY